MPEDGYRANDPTAQRLGQAAGDGQIPKRGDTEQGEYQQASPPHGLHFDPVSYTHLDVYKRQRQAPGSDGLEKALSAGAGLS